ncbi:MAG: TetR/AcrR family transcriptional regulator [Parahaliea sp.]
MVKLSKHESGKAQRRRHILSVADRCLDENGISMRQLAREAGVSITTLYNLFGSKHNILASLMEADALEFRQRIKASHHGNALDKLFFAIGLAAEAFRRDEVFYRGLFCAAMNSDNRAVTPFYIEQRSSIWHELLQQAVVERKLSADLNVKCMAKNIVNLYSGLIHEWMLGISSAEQMRAQVGYNLALALLAVARSSSSKRSLQAHAAKFSELIN